IQVSHKARVSHRKYPIEKYPIEKYLIEKYLIEKYLIEKYLIEKSQQIALWILNIRIISIRAIIKWLQCAKGRGTLEKYFPGLLDCGRDDPLGPD
ncbi:hypothetical protein E4U27_008383, partial [Claviceps purpurea]